MKTAEFWSNVHAKADERGPTTLMLIEWSESPVDEKQLLVANGLLAAKGVHRGSDGHWYQRTYVKIKLPNKRGAK